MTIDMAQFHQVFFEESFESLDVMESGLLNMDPSAVDPEQINAIFRAAHSIKGGSGTFGFTHIATFTHVMETLLDQMRDGRRPITPTGADLLLHSVDVLRMMLKAAQDGQSFDEVRVLAQKEALDQFLRNATPSPPPSPAAAVPATTQPPLTVRPKGWHIVFSPLPHMMRSGNDPLRVLRELALLGDLKITADTSAIPRLGAFEPEDCCLSWDLFLYGEVSRSALDDVFAWVEDECDLAILPLIPETGEEESRECQPTVVMAAVSTQIPLAVSPPAVPPPEPSLPVKTESRPAVAKTTNPKGEKGEKGGKGEKGEKAEKGEKGDNSPSGSSSSIRVDIQKIDTLINMVGELVITQSMLGMLGRDFEITRLEKLRNGLGQLERHTRELQESVMQIRMLPISFTFSRFPRLVHDLGTKLNKKVELRMSGENTEVDKTVIEKIGDPLVHLVRNSLDHGIEAPEARLAAGKPETGRVNLNAYHRGGNIVIEVKDDGAGLNTERLVQKAMERGLIPQDAHLSDAEAHALIFLPGFSTAQLVSDVSGRGVGMDVVRRNIHELGGHVDIVSRLGQGTNFIIRLPLTLAILDGQTIAVGREIYIVPLVSIVESIQVRPEMVNLVAGKGETFKLRNEYLSIVRLHEVFDIPDAKAKHLTEGLLVVVEGEGCRCGLFIDDLHGQQQVVVKSLEHNYGRVEGISGATILGDGSVALILDIPGLIRLARGHPMIADTTPQGFANTRLPTAQYLTFSLAEEAYGVDILRVQEIRGWEAVTRLPNTPAYVKGVLNLRGAIVPVFDLRQRFDLPWQPYGKDTVVIVLRAVGHKGMRSIGVVVDGVSDVLNANPGDLRAAPDFGTKISTEFIAGLASQGDSMVMLLDVDKLLGARSDSHEAFATEPSEALSRITIS